MDNPKHTNEQKDAQPAFTMSISIQSCSTPLAVGLVVMLIVGLLGGYALRYATSAQSPAAAGDPTLALVPIAPAMVTPGIVTPAILTPAAATPTALSPAQMAAIISQTRHFMGDANASVTIIEFGDFQ